VLIGVIALVVALIAAGLVFGIPGTGFHGLLKPGKSTGHAQASYANGYQKTWTVSASDLGLTDQTYLWVQTVSDTTWIIQVQDYSQQDVPRHSMIGVDAATGAKKWQTTPVATQTSCASQPLKGVIYCAAQGRIYSVDPETGQATPFTDMFQAGTIQTVNGPVTLNDAAEQINIEALGDNLLAFGYTPPNDFTLISLVSATGKTLWTNAAPIFPSCGASPAPDVLTGGIILLNSLCMTAIFDARTGELLHQPGGFPVVEKNVLWAGGGAGDNATFTSSDGTSWTIYASSDSDATGLRFADSDVAAPLTALGTGASRKVEWIQPDGSSLWSTELPGDGFFSIFDGKHLIVTDYAGAVWSLSPKDGSILWHTTMPGSIQNEGDPDTVIFADGTVMTQWGDAVDAYSVDTGQLYWTATDFRFSTWIRPSDPMSLVGYSMDGHSVYRIDPVAPQPTPGSRPS